MTKVMRNIRKQNSENHSIFKHPISADLSTMSYSFKLGWNQIQQKDVAEAKKLLMEAIGITTRENFLNRLKGNVEPKVSEVVAIENVFAKYGITEIWGE